MTPKKLAGYAVQITQVIKTTLTLTPEQVILMVITKIPDLTPEDVISFLTGVADRLKYKYKDVYDLIKIMQAEALNIAQDNELAWNTFWQSLAQGLLFVAQVVYNMLPDWAKIIINIITAYANLKAKQAA